MSGVSDAIVLGDQTRLRHLFLNLLTNAINTSPRGGRVELVMQRRSETEVSVSVRDTGIGIAAVDLPQVFQRFQPRRRRSASAASHKKSHVALVLGGALGEVKPLIADGSVTVSDINSAERAVERNMLLEITNLKRGLAILATVGATAPFVRIARAPRWVS